MTKSLPSSIAALIAFVLTFSAHVQVYNNEQTSTLYLEFSGWDASFPGVKYLLAAVAIGFTIFRYVRHHELNDALIKKLKHTTVLALSLVIIKGLSFFSAVTNIVPIIIALWAPHAFWAALFSWFVYLNWPNNVGNTPTHYKTGIVSSLLFFFSLLIYGGYTFYFCQVTMLHGDEAHYLRFTQSLLHDGDLDLTNNIGWEQESEYHTMPFGIHKAPASPEGKIHSLHPIGLSVLLMPAYKFGLLFWGNPRLACALFMALLTSFCIPLIYIWLTRIGVSNFTALISTIIITTLSPIAYYSNQIYPDIPGLLITLIVLIYLSHWQISGGGYKPVGCKSEIPLIGVSIFLLGILPFLHPRFTPLTVLLGFGIITQIYYSKKKFSATLIASTISIGIIFLHISYHFAFSNDWLGPFRPGNTLNNALDIATWRFSLFGHWFTSQIGLIHLAPIFLLSLVGIIKLGISHRKTFLMAIVFYCVTAGVNGLHPHWTFGYCLPARFLITAIPIITLGLSIALPLVKNSVCSVFFMSFLLAISAESIIISTDLPEDAFGGEILLSRIIEDYYTFTSHFFPKSSVQNIEYYVLHWIFIIVTIYFLLGSDLAKYRKKTLFAIALLLNLFAWNNYSEAFDIKRSVSYYIFPNKYAESKDLKYNYSLNTRPLENAVINETGGVTSQPNNLPQIVGSALLQSPSITNYYFNKRLNPGIYSFQIPDLTYSNSKIALLGHILLSQRNTVQAVSNYETKQPFVLLDGGEAQKNMVLQATNHMIGYLKIVHSGGDTMSFSKIKVAFTPKRLLNTKRTKFLHIDNEGNSNQSSLLASSVLPEGKFNATFNISGNTISSLFEKHPRPLQLAIYYTSVNEAVSHYQHMVNLWFSYDHDTNMAIKNQTYFYPKLESVQPIWKTFLPFLSKGFNVSFELPKRGTVWLLAKYEGPLNIKIDSVTLFEEKQFWKGNPREQ